MLEEWGPLAGLAGIWEGDRGLDVAYSHANNAVSETRFRERASFSTFGPVENGAQVLYGLDYRTAAWRPGEDLPFHTEVGYWLWDASTSTVMRCFMVPRGVTLLAGGTAPANARSFTMSAECGSETFGILSNPYLAAGPARTVRYTCTVTLGDDGSLSYEETTTIEMEKLGGEYAHTDRNTLYRVE